MNEIQRPEVSSRQPPFEVPGLVRITHLSPQPEGFAIRTRSIQPLHARVHSPHFPFYPPKITGKELPNRKRVREQMVDEVNMALKTVGILIPENATSEERHASIQQLLPEQRERYRNMLAGKLGLREIDVQDNTIITNVTKPNYRMYRAVDSPTNTKEALEFANPAAVAMVVITRDNKLILQYRAPFQQDPATGKKAGNYFYGGIPGASAAGYFDAPKGAHGTGKPGEVTTQTVVAMAFKEAREEIGLLPTDVTSVAIAGLAEDLLKKHDEMLLVARSNKSLREIKQGKIPEETANSDYDFSEKFLAIDATPKAIETLLTQVQCPLPPTHLAAFFAAGYNLAIEKYGKEMADVWRQRVQKGVEENYKAINARVIGYWQNHQEEAQVHPEGRPLHNQFGYDPAYSPSEQGLPDLQSELERTKLVKKHWIKFSFRNNTPYGKNT